MSYNFKNIENKWQNIWEKNNAFKFDKNSKKKKFYILEMFPFPSGKIHMGHVRNYVIGDIIARFKKMQNFNILHPIGFDAFGLPAENAAIEYNMHPKKWTYNNIENMKKRLKMIGLSYDWDREFATCDLDYYKFEQEIFIEFYKNNLVYQKESYVNWDPVDQTVLANEQVIDGKGWRSGAKIEKKKLKQWFLRVSDFSEELLQELDSLTGWDKRVISMQKKWIGKSEGAIIKFKIEQNDKIDDASLKIYTSKPHTIFGASFIAISPHHPICEKLAKSNIGIQNFIKECEKGGVDEKSSDLMEKTGINTNLYAVHPFLNGVKIPIYIANFVLMDYGTGSVFGCPAHDKRDYDFAIKYLLPIKQVIHNSEDDEIPYLNTGIMINSEFLNNLQEKEAKSKIIELLIKNDKGERKINYRLKDWGISRQRYWGCPIPMVYVNNNVIPEQNLPVELPENIEFKNNKGNPLNHSSWKYTKYNEKEAIRETDTLDTFFESSWYFLRFASQPKNKIFDKEEINTLLPVDQYIGGIEHAVLHLLYARFFVKALNKCGYIDIKEPFKNLLTQGMVCHKSFKDKNGKWLFPNEIEIIKEKFIHKSTKKEVTVGRSEKMSKSKKNIIEPTDIIDNYGTDATRLFILSDTPPEKDLEWNDKALEGCFKYINKIYNFISNFVQSNNLQNYDIDYKNLNNRQIELVKKINKSIKLVKEFYESNLFNSAIAKIREFSNFLERYDVKNYEDKKILFFAIEKLILLFSPITPHLSEELWNKIGKQNYIYQESFPEFDEKFTIDNEINLAIQINGKLKTVIKVEQNLTDDNIKKIIMENDIIKRNILNIRIKRIIIIKNKLVNIVI